MWERYSENGWIPCAWCPRKMRKTEFEVDRVIPGHQGGTYRRDNILPACGTCNRRRKYSEEGCDADFSRLRTVS
jgi:hypothetical protein